MRAELKSTPYAIIVAVGPDPIELPRLIDLAASIAYHEPGAATLVVVDDAPTPRNLAAKVARPGILDAIDVHHVRTSPTRKYKGGKGICSAIMMGVQKVQERLSVKFALKLDTDSLVIAPFRAKLVARIDDQPLIGMIGACRYGPTGEARDWSMHEQRISSIARFWTLPRALSPSAISKRHFRTVMKAAKYNSYVAGEHCLGGGYGLTQEFFKRMAVRGWSSHPSLWESIDLPEDVMIGLHVRALGLELVDDVELGGVFGVKHVGLAFPPEQLLKRGYAIIHAVKNDPELPEKEIRSFFSDLRKDKAQYAQI